MTSRRALAVQLRWASAYAAVLRKGRTSYKKSPVRQEEAMVYWWSQLYDCRAETSMSLQIRTDKLIRPSVQLSRKKELIRPRLLSFYLEVE